MDAKFTRGSGQVVHLANELPSYQQNISKKLQSFQGTGDGPFDRASRCWRSSTERWPGQRAPDTDASTPVPVVVGQAPDGPLGQLESYVGPLLAPLATAGVVEASAA